MKPGQLSPQQDAAISLNASLIDERDNVGIFFALYDTPILFPIDRGNSIINTDGSIQTKVGSRVLAATVGPGLNFQNLDDPVIVVLRLVTVRQIIL